MFAMTCNVLRLQKCQASLHESDTLLDFVGRCHRPAFVKSHYALICVHAMLCHQSGMGFRVPYDSRHVAENLLEHGSRKTEDPTRCEWAIELSRIAERLCLHACCAFWIPQNPQNPCQI